MTERPPSPYREIDLLSYIRIVRKHFNSILFTGLVFAFITFVFSIYSLDTTYEARAVISIGNFQGTPLETADQITDGLTLADSRIKVTRGASAAVLSISTRAKTPDEASTHLDSAIQHTLERHKELFAGRSKILEEQTAFLKGIFEENESRVVRFQQMVDRLSPYDLPQATALQGYLGVYNSGIGVRTALERELRGLQLQALDFQETKLIWGPDVKPISPSKNIAANMIAAFVLGAFLSVVWVFSRMWWASLAIS